MPGCLIKAHKHRDDPPPEFVGLTYLAKYLDVPYSKLRNTALFDNLPYRYSETGELQYRRTAALEVIDRHNLTPPDHMHPLYEYTQAEAMVELGIGPDKYVRDTRAGLIVTHPGKDGRLKVYRKDIDYYRLNIFTRTIVSRMTEPLNRRMVVFMLGLSMNYFVKKLEKTRIPRAPRKRRCPVKFTKSDILAYFDSIAWGPYRKEPFPEYIPSELVLLYSGFSHRKLVNMKQIKRLVPERYVTETGKKRWGYRKSAIDAIVEEDSLRDYYGDGCKYYIAKHIKYKFNKSDAWIKEFIVGKCRRVNYDGVVLPKNATGFGKWSGVGWCREDVEAVVNSGAVCHLLCSRKKPKKKKRYNKELNRAKHLAAVAKPPVAFASPVDQMTAALEAVFAEKDREREAKRNERYALRHAEMARMTAIRGILSTGKEANVGRPIGRNAILRLEDEPQKVTILVTKKGIVHGRYYDSPGADDERIFPVADTQVSNHRMLPPCFARAVMSGLKSFVSARAKRTPSWVIIATSMTLVSDPMFHDILDGIPGNIGAIAPFGYSGFLPDGSWLRNPRTFGSYSLYGTTPAEVRKVYGEVNDGRTHEVGTLGGPFVAIRGIFINELYDLDLPMFHRLGGIMGMIPQAVSCVCSRYGIHMAQVPVESWMPGGYELVDGTPEANLASDTVRRYLGLTAEELKSMKQGR